MTNHETNKQYIVFSISRLDLQLKHGFTHEQVSKLSANDMHWIAENVRKHYSYLEPGFGKTVRIITLIALEEKSDTDNLTTEEAYDYAYLERTYHADRQTIEELLLLIREKYQIQGVPLKLLERELQIVLDKPTEHLQEEQTGEKDHLADPE